MADAMTEFRTRIAKLIQDHDLTESQAYLLANAEMNANGLQSPAPGRIPHKHGREHPFAQGLDGLWHVRVDDFWDNSLQADVRAHAVCGDIWSCHVSDIAPVLLDRPQKERRHCRVCFPVGRKSAQ